MRGGVAGLAGLTWLLGGCSAGEGAGSNDEAVEADEYTDLGDVCEPDDIDEPDEAPLVPGLALFHVESDTDQALWWMDLSAEDPLAAAAELASGPWFPSHGRGDARFAFAHTDDGDSTTPDPGVLLDLRVLPPTPIDPGLPATQILLDGDLTPDSEGLIVRTFDTMLGTELLWQRAIDPDGTLGALEQLTWPSPQLADVLPLRLWLPESRHYSADGRVLFVHGSTAASFGTETFRVDLDAPGELDFVHSSDGEWYREFPTPDGDALIVVEDLHASPYQSVDCFDLASHASLGCDIEGSGEGVADVLGRTLIMMGYDDYLTGEDASYAIVHVCEPHAKINPLELGDLAVDDLQLLEDAAHVVMVAEGTLWRAAIDAGPPGPLVAVTGLARGEPDVVEYDAMPRRDIAVLTRATQDGMACEVVRFEDGALVDGWPIGPCSSVGSSNIRANHLYVWIYETNDATRLWHVDLADPLAQPFPVSAVFAAIAWRIAPLVSADGRWAFHCESEGCFMSGLAQPGTSTLLSVAGMTATDLVVVP